MKTKRSLDTVSSQTTGNIGLYYICCRLSRLGWNVMPTARNAKGIDIVGYNQAGSKTITVQVKSLSKRNPVPFGTALNSLFANFVIIAIKVTSETPICFVMKPAEIRKEIVRHVKNKKQSCWLPPQSYEKFREKWNRIGSGTQ